MIYSYSLINTTYDIDTKQVVYTFSYLNAQGSFVTCTAESEAALQTHLGTL